MITNEPTKLTNQRNEPTPPTKYVKMDTVLNLGMNDAVVHGLATKTNNPRFAWDSYRRFLEMFGNVVLEIPRYVLPSVLHR